jgi:hypothetical protein
MRAVAVVNEIWQPWVKVLADPDKDLARSQRKLNATSFVSSRESGESWPPAAITTI